MKGGGNKLIADVINSNQLDKGSYHLIHNVEYTKLHTLQQKVRQLLDIVTITLQNQEERDLAISRVEEYPLAAHIASLMDSNPHTRELFTSIIQDLAQGF